MSTVSLDELLVEFAEPAGVGHPPEIVVVPGEEVHVDLHPVVVLGPNRRVDVVVEADPVDFRVLRPSDRDEGLPMHRSTQGWASEQLNRHTARDFHAQLYQALLAPSRQSPKLSEVPPRPLPMLCRQSTQKSMPAGLVPLRPMAAMAASSPPTKMRAPELNSWGDEADNRESSPRRLVASILSWRIVAMSPNRRLVASSLSWSFPPRLPVPSLRN